MTRSRVTCAHHECNKRQNLCNRPQECNALFKDENKTNEELTENSTKFFDPFELTFDDEENNNEEKEIHKIANIICLMLDIFVLFNEGSKFSDVLNKK